jgi:hypothetical protein
MAPAYEATMHYADSYLTRRLTAQCNKRRSIMFTTLADNSKAAIFTVIVLLLAVTAAASVSLWS